MLCTHESCAYQSCSNAVLLRSWNRMQMQTKLQVHKQQTEAARAGKASFSWAWLLDERCANFV
jgi:translation elongation factor EF-1alpha